jgi:hypothetical protein
MGMPAGKLTSFRGGIQDLSTAAAERWDVAAHRRRGRLALAPQPGRTVDRRARRRRAIEADASSLLAGGASARIVSSLDRAAGRQLEPSSTPRSRSSASVSTLGAAAPAGRVRLPGPARRRRAEPRRPLGFEHLPRPGARGQGTPARHDRGGARDPEAVQLPDEVLLDIVSRRPPAHDGALRQAGAREDLPPRPRHPAVHPRAPRARRGDGAALRSATPDSSSRATPTAGLRSIPASRRRARWPEKDRRIPRGGAFRTGAILVNV